MKNILVVKANNRPDGISTKMYDTFMSCLNSKEGIQVNTFDVFEEDMPYFGQDLFNAFGKLQAGNDLNENESRILNAKAKAKEALNAADIVVFAFPLWNLSVPAPLKTFLDYILEAGYTYKYNEQGQLQQLMGNKKVAFLNARGGMYSTPEMSSMDMSANYVKMINAGFIGMEPIGEVIIEGHNADPANSANIINNGLEEVKSLAKNIMQICNN